MVSKEKDKEGPMGRLIVGEIGKIGSSTIHEIEIVTCRRWWYSGLSESAEREEDQQSNSM